MEDEAPNVPTPVAFGAKYGLILGLCYGTVVAVVAASLHFFVDDWVPGTIAIVRLLESIQIFLFVSLITCSIGAPIGVIVGAITGRILRAVIENALPIHHRFLWLWGILANACTWLLAFMLFFLFVFWVESDVTEALLGWMFYYILICIGPSLVSTVGGGILAQIYYRRYIAAQQSTASPTISPLE